MFARLGIVTTNVGNTTTFRRSGCEGTIPDVTFVSEKITHNIKGWRVLEIYTASDHQYISFLLNPGEDTSTTKPSQTTWWWNAKKLDTEILLSEINRRVKTGVNEWDATSTVEHISAIITTCCNKAMPKIKAVAGRKAVYWWNDTIDESRRNCIRTRKKYTRSRRRGAAGTEHEAYKELKKHLQSCIFKSKKYK